MIQVKKVCWGLKDGDEVGKMDLWEELSQGLVYYSERVSGQAIRRVWTQRRQWVV